MKRFFVFVIVCILLSIIIPVAVYFIMMPSFKKNIIERNPGENTVKVFFCDEKTVKTMDVDEYLCGVVAAEMPASFENDALKAQAVAARSYTFYKMKNRTKEHPDADVCTDFAHCKAYKNKDELSNVWKDEYEKNSQKIHRAVYDTSKEVIVYNGEVAMAVFHSQSGGGKTENCEDVWGGEIPYLISVTSEGEENSPGYYSTARYSFEQFKKILEQFYSDICFNDPNDFEILELSEGGNVMKLRVGDKTLSGKEVRSMFGLRSSCFTLSYKDEHLTFDVKGYGHGVGMSQYGANELAKEGYNYVEILKHYYTNTEISYV